MPCSTTSQADQDVDSEHAQDAGYRERRGLFVAAANNKVEQRNVPRQTEALAAGAL